jgi:hypothetical protein
MVSSSSRIILDRSRSQSSVLDTMVHMRSTDSTPLFRSKPRPGVMPTAAGPFAAGSQYRTNETFAQRWVHATFVETALVAHDLIFAPPSSEERERYYAEGCILATLFGIPRASLPWRVMPARLHLCLKGPRPKPEVWKLSALYLSPSSITARARS